MGHEVQAPSQLRPVEVEGRVVEGPAGAGRVVSERPPLGRIHQRPTLQHDRIQFLGGGRDQHGIRAARGFWQA
jgi:hypothetical protein